MLGEWVPFAGYSDFQDCIKRNQGKSDPKGYCASIMRRVEGKDMNELRLCSLVYKSNDSSGKIMLVGEPSNNDLDLHGDYMTSDFLDKMADTINNAPKGLPQFNGHGSLIKTNTIFDMLSKTARAEKVFVKDQSGKETEKLRVYSTPNEKHEKYSDLIWMLENNFPIQQSIVVANPKMKKEFKKDLGLEVNAIYDGKLKAIDFVGIGANEGTDVMIAKGASGFYFTGGSEMSETNKPEETQVAKAEEKKTCGEGEVWDEKTMKCIPKETPKAAEGLLEKQEEMINQKIKEVLEKNLEETKKGMEKKLEELILKQFESIKAESKGIVSETKKQETGKYSNMTIKRKEMED